MNAIMKLSEDLTEYCNNRNTPYVVGSYTTEGKCICKDKQKSIKYQEQLIKESETVSKRKGNRVINYLHDWYLCFKLWRIDRKLKKAKLGIYTPGLDKH